MSLFRTVLQFISLFVFVYALESDAKTEHQKSIDVLVKKLVEETDAPSLSVAVSHKGELLAAAAFGYADKDKLIKATPNTLYRTGSISKVVGTIAFMKLVESGQVSLQDHIRQFLTYLPKHYSSIKLIHLFTHTSGIRHYRFGEYGTNIHYPTIEKATEVFREDELEFAPGTGQVYTTYGINLIQGVIESVSGLALEVYLKKVLFKPAEMKDTMLEVKGREKETYAIGYRSFFSSFSVKEIDVSNKYIGGGMRSTPSDLVKMVSAVQAGKILSAKTRQLMYSVPFPKVAENRMIGWRKDEYKGQLTYAHGGAINGFESLLVHFTKDDITVAVMVNQDDYDHTSSTLYKVYELIKANVE